MRIVLLFSALVTVAHGITCEEHESCATAICTLFDDVCPDDKPLCQQLTESPWYECHPEAEEQLKLDNCATHGCGAGADCHQTGIGVFCTCDTIIVEAGEDCPTTTETEHVCSKNCHESAHCSTDGTLEFCICEDGRLREENQPCPDWVVAHPQQNQNQQQQQQQQQQTFDCGECGTDKICRDQPEMGMQAGCYCRDMLVSPGYPCYHDPSNTTPLSCAGHCLGTNSICFMEHGVPVCRCTDGDLVESNASCIDDRSDSFTEFIGNGNSNCEVNVCGPGAECHYHQDDGYVCTCNTNTDNEYLVAHYQPCQ